MIRASTAEKSLIESRQHAGTFQHQQEKAQGQSSPLGRLLKASFDLAITVPGLLFIAPLFLLIALLVKLDSPGPVFYRRRVLGRDGRVFYAFKFRTMYINGDEILAQYQDFWREKMGELPTTKLIN